jgi:hypothetical protein
MIAKAASAAVAMAVISPDRSTDMGVAYGVPQRAAEGSGSVAAGGAGRSLECRVNQGGDKQPGCQPDRDARGSGRVSYSTLVFDYAN